MPESGKQASSKVRNVGVEALAPVSYAGATYKRGDLFEMRENTAEILRKQDLIRIKEES